MNNFLDRVVGACYVQNMNKKNDHMEDYRSFLLLDEISKDNKVTQRTLSKTLGIALGLVNSYMKNLASKGYITIADIPPKRYSYYLTPNGFLEKTRLAYHHLQNFTGLYKVARRDFRQLFQNLYSNGVRDIVFCGVDEVAEIAYLSLQEVDIRLAAVYDIGQIKKKFFGQAVAPISEIQNTGFDMVIITSFLDGGRLKEELLKKDVPEDKIRDISSGGWLKKVKE